MTKVQYQKALAKLEREADEKGCCILPAKPLFDPDDAPRAQQLVHLALELIRGDRVLHGNLNLGCKHALADGDAVEPRQNAEHLLLHVQILHFLPPMVADSAAFSTISTLPRRRPISSTSGSSRRWV